MYIEVTQDIATDLARSCGRYDQLGGYYGITALLEYYEEYEHSTNEKVEFDVIALCCEWSHYTELRHLVGDYSSLPTPEDLGMDEGDYVGDLDVEGKDMSALMADEDVPFEDFYTYLDSLKEKIQYRGGELLELDDRTCLVRNW